MLINPGNFDKRIKIVKYELKKDADGFEEKAEVVFLMTWAHVTNVSGTEILRSNSDFSKVKTRFLIRTPKIKLDKDMEIKFNKNTYEVVYINDYSYDRLYTEIMTEFVVKLKLFHLQKVFKLSKMLF